MLAFSEDQTVNILVGLFHSSSPLSSATTPGKQRSSLRSPMLSADLTLQDVQYIGMSTNLHQPVVPTRSLIDCGKEIQHQAKAISVAVEILKAASGKFDFSTKKIDSLSSEDTLLTELMKQYCELYKVTDEATYSTMEYRTDIRQIGNWKVELVAFSAEVHADGAGTKNPDDNDKKSKQSKLDQFINAAKKIIDGGTEKTEKTIREQHKT